MTINKKKYRIILIVVFFFTTRLFALDTLNTKLFDYAKKTPSQFYDNISELTKYLSIPTKIESEKVEIFSYWIAINISYDVYEYSIRNNFNYDVVHNPQNAYAVFKTRKAVCAGYSDLLKEMCKSEKINCYVIVGYSKGYGYIDNVIPDKTDHAWNSVFVDGKWQLVDATWAEGYANNEDGKMIAIKALDVSYIFMEPRKFILKHFPVESQWQLLSNPLSFNTFFTRISPSASTKNQLINYNYLDTIKYYERLSEKEKEIRFAENNYQYTKNKWEYAFDCFAYADWNYYKYNPTQKNLIISLYYFKKSKSLFQEFSGEKSRNKINKCLERINKIEKLLNSNQN